jgi:VIT1/CCC1 family predicted Fe2+/Mn2+ transporter
MNEAIIPMKAKPTEIKENHRSQNTGWIRAAVLGANDGILSTSSLILGVIAAQANEKHILLTGIAGLVAGSLSMAAGEYVSVSSQADIEKADLQREAQEISENPEFEKNELADIYVNRGLKPELAFQVAVQLMAHDAIGAHAREELGITEALAARPIQAALSSAVSFAVGATMPLLITLISPLKNMLAMVSLSSLVFLITLGVISAKVGGAVIWKAAMRVAFWGALAMAVTTVIGSILGAHI